VTRPQERQFTVVLLPWGNVIEDFLGPLGVSLDQFCDEFSGSWIFSYADALRGAGATSVVMCVSKQVSRITRRVHTPSGAVMVFLPPSRTYRWLLTRMRNPYGRSPTEVFGHLTGWRRLLAPLYALCSPLVLYLATPILPLVRALREERCDAILCQEYEYPRFDVCWVIGWWLRIPVFASFQGGDYQRSPLEARIRPAVMKRCAGVIIGSGVERERVRRRYAIAADRIASIPNPVDTRFWVCGDRAAARALLSIPSEALVVAWHGRVDIRKKGLDVLLEAWQLLDGRIDRATPLCLLLVGSGGDNELLRQRLDAWPRHRVVWVRAFVNDRRMIRNYLAAGDVYVFPSRHEGFPMAPLEAMSCGLPVIATDGSGIRDLLSAGEAYGGVVVPAEDSQALADALARQLSNDEGRSQLGLHARKRVVAFAGADHVGQRLRRFLDSRGHLEHQSAD
jgi:glycosyltransferase involved in cell wall biosynthesis